MRHAPQHEEFGGPAELAIIGGSGLYALLDGAVEHTVDTPYGAPSDAIAVCEIAGRRVAFLPRHGKKHQHPPHRIPYRANLWALRSLGVRQILAPCAVGGLRPEQGAGTFVLPDQMADRTSGRIQTYYDVGAAHVSFADPYCPAGRATVLSTAAASGVEIVDGGAMVVIEGPRFSTRAESQWHAGAGFSLVNMTGHPEAVLARELALCYTAIALVTDLDAGIAAGPDADVDAGTAAHGAVTQEEVFRVFAENTERLRRLLFAVVAALPAQRACPCPNALDGITLPFELP